MRKPEDNNLKRYNQIWKHVSLQKPTIWSSWEIVKGFVGKRCLEVGCGNYPKIPLEDGFFLDTSKVAVSSLKEKGFNVYLGSAENLPFKNNFFDLAVAWEVLEHLEDDKKALSEISRVLKKEGYFLFSVPLGKDKFSKLDEIVGHKRRYEPEELTTMLKENNFNVLKFRCPQLFRYFEKIPYSIPLMIKLYSQPAHVRYFNSPKPLIDLFMKFCASLGRIFAGSWRPGPLRGLKKEISIQVFCRKIR